MLFTKYVNSKAFDKSQIFDGYYQENGTLSNELHQHYRLKGCYSIKDYVKRDAVVLELGCGGGWALLPYSKSGYRYYGFDYNADYIQFGKKHYNLNLFIRGVNEAVNKKIKADYLFMNHVLEHTLDPIGFLKSLKPLLQENAIINISVPSINFMCFGGGGSATRLLDTLQIAHTVLFDDITLAYTVKKAGFRILNHIGGNILLSYSSNNTDFNMQIGLKNRGKVVLNTLKLYEKTPWRTSWIPSFFKSKSHYLHFLCYPLQVFKKLFSL